MKIVNMMMQNRQEPKNRNRANHFIFEPIPEKVTIHIQLKLTALIGKKKVVK